MSADFRVSGTQEILKRLRKLETNRKNSYAVTMQNHVKSIMREAEQNAPVLTGHLQATSYLISKNPFRGMVNHTRAKVIRKVDWRWVDQKEYVEGTVTYAKSVLMKIRTDIGFVFGFAASYAEKVDDYGTPAGRGHDFLTSAVQKAIPALLRALRRID